MNKITKKNFILVLHIFWLTIIPASYANQIPVDYIVAIVDNTVITNTELLQAIKIFTQDHPRHIPQLRNKVLNNLIDEKIQLGLAKNNNITVSKPEINKLIATIAHDNAISEHQLYQKLAATGITASQYYNQLKNAVIIHRLQQQEIAPKIQISAQEINDFKQHHLPQVKEYHILDIVINVPEQAQKQQVKQQAQLAKQLSQQLINHQTQLLPKAHKNDLGWLKLNELPSIFTATVANMAIKSYSAPLKADNGYHILHLIAQRKVQAEPTMTAIEIKQLIFTSKFEQEVKNWLNKLRKQHFIRKYSSITSDFASLRYISPL